MMDDEQHIGKKQSWPNQSYDPYIFLDGLRKSLRTSIRAATALFEIRTKHLLNTNLERYLHTKPVDEFRDRALHLKNVFSPSRKRRDTAFCTDLGLEVGSNDRRLICSVNLNRAEILRNKNHKNTHANHIYVYLSHINYT
jgi:hypothetical protein